MRSLLLNSIVVFILLGCSPKVHPDLSPAADQQRKLEPLFSIDTKSYLYKAAIDYNDKYFSGLLFIKPSAASTFRLVFTNELGLKFFDLELNPEKMIVHHIMDFPFQKLVLKALEKDFRLLLMNNLDQSKSQKLQKTDSPNVAFKFKRKKEHIFYFVNSFNRVEKIESASNKKVKVEVDVDNYQEGIPQTINLKHNNIKFNLKLDYLKR